ncbi:MAG TPA: sialate O-acetylesterase [Candidatus Sulfotelmatobacter sp.]|nr:sialate O-acetylesterase [Candidatus Sulfotelmatobacter sp.]
MIRSHSHFSVLRIALALIALGILTIAAQADVSVPALLADHMVVQRGLPVHVWGMAAPHEAVSVTFRGETKAATADDDGRWTVYLSPGEAGGPFQMTIKATNTITLNDILVGDVWVASGQSNMEFPMTELVNAQTEIAAAQYPKIRFFMVKHKPADYPLEDAESKGWAVCTPETVADASAVAYFFARHLQQKLGVPIGVIESYWGGTAAESWTSLHALSADAALMPVFAARAKTLAGESTVVLHEQREEREFQKAVEQAKADGKPLPTPRWHPDFAAWAPAALYNGMIAPLTPFAIRGVIWYQGESNSGPDRAPLYARLFQAMIRDWRNAWGEGDFPFLFVQIANWNAGPDSQWPEVRNAQRQTLALKNTGMAVTIDIGDPVDIHPKNKQDVGLRLALAARAIAFGEKVEWSGPLVRQVTQEEHALRVWFDHAGGLTAKGAELTGFEVAGADGKYSLADAKIEGESVVVSSSAVPIPVSVRYAWAANPNCNLFNKEGLPASPFQAPE